MTDYSAEQFNMFVHHPLQAFEWGEFRTKTNVKVVRKFHDGTQNGYSFQMTIHKVPHTPFTIGYVPKGELPTTAIIEELRSIGKMHNCIFIQLEPNITKNQELGIKNQDENIFSKFETIIHNSKFKIQPSARPLFTKYTFELDLTKSEEELLKNFHSKTRYNIKVAQKHNVIVKEDDSEKAFEEYLRLTQTTTTRQGFYAHTKEYHRKMWETLKVQGSKFKVQSSYNELSAHLLTATYQDTILTTWILFVFKDTLYYPYGASSNEHRETMSSNLMMWEAIRFGKKLGLKKFDMWGSLSEHPNTKDPWYGFHRFKEGYGPKLVEFVGSYDLVINPVLYQCFKIANALRWILLRLKK